MELPTVIDNRMVGATPGNGSALLRLPMHHSLSFGRLGNPSEREGRVNGRGSGAGCLEFSADWRSNA